MPEWKTIPTNRKASINYDYLLKNRSGGDVAGYKYYTINIL